MANISLPEQTAQDDAVKIRKLLYAAKSCCLAEPKG